MINIFHLNIIDDNDLLDASIRQGIHLLVYEHNCKLLPQNVISKNISLGTHAWRLLGISELLM